MKVHAVGTFYFVFKSISVNISEITFSRSHNSWLEDVRQIVPVITSMISYLCVMYDFYINWTFHERLIFYC